MPPTPRRAWTRAGADDAVRALVDVLRTIDPGRPSRSALESGHYAAVMRLDDRTGIALSTDGVGSKVIVAEQLGRFDTVGHRLHRHERERRDLRGRGAAWR